jgi:hypothetical protein
MLAFRLDLDHFYVSESTWGDLAFEVEIGDYRFMIAAQQGTSAD